VSELRTLYRPVGVQELELILATGCREFPPRLESQPIFYPVLNFKYAEQIAREWNTKDETSGYAGFVTAFRLATEFLHQFPERIVGAAAHRELWIPAERLHEFNRQIAGRIILMAAYYGEKYRGPKYVIESSEPGIVPLDDS
jgi:hypothetical protein